MGSPAHNHGFPRHRRRTDPQPSIRSDPPAGACSPNGQDLLPERGFRSTRAVPILRTMDPLGARLLAARIKAGVSVGTRIELVGDADGDSGLTQGDRGVVDDIDDRGIVRVVWDRGCVNEIDPEQTPFRPFAA
jgi:Domain of unknown function (DUF4314)